MALFLLLGNDRQTPTRAACARVRVRAHRVPERGPGRGYIIAAGRGDRRNSAGRQNYAAVVDDHYLQIDWVSRHLSKNVHSASSLVPLREVLGLFIGYLSRTQSKVSG